MTLTSSAALPSLSNILLHGKTTIMKSIATNQVKGFPDSSTIRTVYIQEEHDADFVDLDMLAAPVVAAVSAFHYRTMLDT
jgi:hypothetical protein